MPPDPIETLTDTLIALPVDQYPRLLETLTRKTINRTPQICGGNARIRQTRIAVWTLISLQQQGADDTELLDDFPGLTPFDLIAARTYYRNHPHEIDRLIADSDP
ncbi:MAG: DUF433 domain-containing protein [Cyanobacteria bacterium P01_F01_bin.153]